MIAKKRKPKKCRICRQSFMPVRDMQPTCLAVACQQEFALAHLEKMKAKEAKAERQRIQQDKVARRPIKDCEAKTQDAVNALRRAQDQAAGYGCITCGRHDADEWHAGHFIPRGVSNGARYEYTNIWLQCRSCNFFGGGGRATAYETNLVGRVGQAEVDRLKAIPHKRTWTREELAEIEARAKAELKALTKVNQ